MYAPLHIGGRGAVSLGDNCQVGRIVGSPHKYTWIDALCPDSRISIGNNARLHAARITAKYEVTIGDDVIIEDAGIVDTDFHSLDTSRGEPLGECSEECRISIGNRVCIGAQSIITKGVVIGDGVVVAPSAVVSRSVKPNHFAYGNPVVSTAREDSHG